MVNKTTTISKQEFESKINQTLAKLKENFTPSGWTKEERQEIKNELLEVENLAKSILEKTSKSNS